MNNCIVSVNPPLGWDYTKAQSTNTIVAQVEDTLPLEGLIFIYSYFHVEKNTLGGACGCIIEAPPLEPAGLSTIVLLGRGRFFRTAIPGEI